MMNQKNPVSISHYSDIFEGLACDDIYVLNEQNAITIWKNHVDQKATSFFKLPDEHWLVTGHQETLGHWLNDFNEDHSQRIQQLLNSTVDWNDEDIIFFSISHLIILETSWKTFKNNWIYFLHCDDDCPILVNSSYSKEALVFRPIGDFIRINGNH
ncbi:MAG: DUF2947 family protein [Bacteroidota bacterium]